MHNKLQQYPIDPMFDELYGKAGGFTKPLSNAALQEVYDVFKAYLSAKNGILGAQITYQFDAAKYAPEVNTLNLPLTLKTNVSEYKFTDYKVLIDTLLVDFCIPIGTDFTIDPKGKTLLPAADLAKAFITLINDRQQKVVFQEPLLDYFRDEKYWQGKGKFFLSRMDWDNSLIQFADNTIPNANVGKIILPVAKYIDMKKYPYLAKVL